MVGLHPSCCECFGEGTCPSGTCCTGTGNYSGTGCPETYNVNITLNEICLSCYDTPSGCDDHCYPAVDLNFTILKPCGDCTGVPFGQWCPTQIIYQCEGTYPEDPCVPAPTCICPSYSPHGYNVPDDVFDVGFLFRHRAGSYYFPPEDGRIRMEFEIYALHVNMMWYLRMDKPAPNCIDWTVDDAGWNMQTCNNCQIGYWGNCNGYCNEANPSDPNYFGCCYQCAGLDCCEGCTIENGGLILNNWGRPSAPDVPLYPRTWSNAGVLGFTIT